MTANQNNAIGVIFDHLAVPAHHPEQSARFLGDILGIPISRDGADDEFFCLRLDEEGQILFTETEKFNPIHFALRVSEEKFEEVVDRLQKGRICFGNDPEEHSNGKTADPLGGKGRVYFCSADGHLFEIC